MSFQNCFTGFGAESIEPRMTRMGTDKAEAQGLHREPVLALCFKSLPKQACTGL
jgi:hypothetical protein